MLHLGVVDGGQNRLSRQILEGLLPVLAYWRLTYSDDGYVSHFSLESLLFPSLCVGAPRYSMRILPRWRA